jgi:hypothetical protein
MVYEPGFTCFGTRTLSAMGLIAPGRRRSRTFVRGSSIFITVRRLAHQRDHSVVVVVVHGDPVAGLSCRLPLRHFPSRVAGAADFPVPVRLARVQ